MASVLPILIDPNKNGGHSGIDNLLPDPSGDNGGASLIPPGVPVPDDQDNSNISRHDFPDDFVFGTGTAAYQVEGAATAGGKGISVWDEFARRTPGRIADGSNGNIACDMYYRFKEDIKSMKRMGFNGYRFSISWPRILPGGRCCNGINREGIDYYNDIIDTVLANGMKPYVTLFHWDLPLNLEKEYGGFLSEQIVNDFREYVELCFLEFGDRVQWWTTINEPWTYAVNGYVKGNFPPAVVPSDTARPLRTNLPSYRSVDIPILTAMPVDTSRVRSRLRSFAPTYDTAKYAYIVNRNLLLAHSAAVHSYRTKFQEAQGGQIGIVLNTNWHRPLVKNSKDDIAAAKRAVDFMLGWFLEPVMYGRYPDSMVEFARDNLPSFSATESHNLKNSVDFVGINYYTTSYASYDPDPTGVGYDADQKLEFTFFRDEVPIGTTSGSPWLYIVPSGLYEQMADLKNRYGKDLPPLYITENGVSEKYDCKLTYTDVCPDTKRTKYHQDHLANLLKVRNDFKMDIRGYFIWAWCDNFEWSEGYTARFGINYIDYANNLTRYPKNSAMWFTKFLLGKKKLLTGAQKRSRDEENSEDESIKRLKAGGDQ